MMSNLELLRISFINLFFIILIQISKCYQLAAQTCKQIHLKDTFLTQIIMAYIKCIYFYYHYTMSILKGFLFILTVITVAMSLDALNPICLACHDIVNQIQHTVPRRPVQQILDIIGTTYCTKKHIQKHNVCKGAVSQMMDSIINSVWRHYSNPHAVCHKLRLCPNQYDIRDLNKDIKNILQGKPNKEWQQPTNRRSLKILHISDLHPDLFYTVGAPAKCSEPVCCRSNVTLKLELKQIMNKHQNGEYLQVSQDEINESPAGYWGSLNSCDLPIQTFQLFLKQISKLDLDLIYWTGDNTPHDIWQQTQSYNLNFTIMLTEKFKKATKAKIIAAMGNHQSFPVNVYDYQGERQSMLIGGLAQTWRDFLDKKAYDKLRTKGFYSITLPDFNNLKIISVNTQAQNDQNWFLLRDPTDAGGMLKWIEQELKQSEAKGQYVHIIGHISPKSAMNEWSMRFNALTDRYSYIIRGQFYGHTHSDHVGLFPSISNKSVLVNTFLIAPSLTTYSDKHPQYRVMTIDYDSLQVTDYEQYLLNLTKFHKKQDNAKFQLFYRFKEAYGLSDMTIRGGMSVFKDKLQKDADTQIQYSRLRSSGTQQGQAKREVYCDTATSPQYEVQCNNGIYKPDKFTKLAGRWKDLKHK